MNGKSDRLIPTVPILFVLLSIIVMWSTRTARRQSRVKSSTMAATLAGNGKGSRDSMICPTQQIEKIMAI